MAENDIELKIGIDATYLETSIKKVLGKIGSTRAMKVKDLPKSPFTSFGKEKTQVGKVHLDPLNKNEFKKIGKLWKLDLYWKWLKGTWNILLRTNPILKSLMGIFEAAISLISMALLYPFLEDIIGVLKGLLLASAGFFQWMKDNKEAVKGFAELGFDAILAKLGLSGIVKVFTYIATSILPKIIPGFKLLGDLLGPVVAWLGEKGLSGVLTKLVTFAAKFINPLLWVSLIADIGKYIFGWVATWSDHPIWVAFWTTLADLSGIVSEVADVFGWIVALFTGGIGDKVSKITGSLDSFDKTLRKNIFGSETGSIFGSAPKTATGGVVTSPQVRMVGEAGPEAIIPLDQMKGMGGTSITVNGMVDEYKFRSIIREEIEKSNRRLSNVRGAVSI